MQTLLAFLTPLFFAAHDPSEPGASRRWHPQFRRASTAPLPYGSDFNPYQFLVETSEYRAAR
ncbi:MAG TPA: hypothetical protein VL993_02215 [Stellaceae bacterium]|nr:hypothetical protein [Stellaceae bacterium]